MLLDMNLQTAISISSDFCTVAWAAECLGCSQRTVMRYVEARMLTASHPRVAPLESRRTRLMLRVDQVEQLRAAREQVRRVQS